MEPYFNKFPIISYNGQNARDISRRVKMYNVPLLRTVNFLPYQQEHDMRPDHIAGQYYEDPTLDWMIHLVNDTVDPYYGWPLNIDEFDTYIKKKYGSLSFAQQAIALFRTNWPSDKTQITVGYYQNNLVDAIRKYWAPVWGQQDILSFTRRQEDWFASTNRIMSVTMIMTSNASFANGELVISAALGLDHGKAEVVQANSSAMTIKNVIDNINVADVIRSRNNNQVNATITAVSIIMENIPLAEAAYWEPVYFYDAEYEANESKRQMNLLNRDLALDTAEQIRRQLNDQ